MKRIHWRTASAVACTALLLVISPARLLAVCSGTATGQLTSAPNGQSVTGTINGSSHTAGYAGVIFATINGQLNVPAFCINLLNDISVGDCFNTGGPTSPQITWLLNHGFGPDNSKTASENASRQAAVWYFSDSFVTTDSHQARVQQIINAVPANPDPQQDVPEMSIDPPSAVNVLPGNLVHSLTVNVTTGGDPLVGQVVNLSTSFGTLSSSTVTTDGTGSATFTVTNSGGTQGTANITATFTYPLPAGTIFNPVVEGKQKLVLATPTSAVLVANATKQWVNGGTIIAHKFLDSNADTFQDPDEPNLANWTMKLFSCNPACDGTGCSLVTSKTTDSNGDANFGSKPAGCYRVDEVFPTPVAGHQNWHNTTLASQLFSLTSNQAEQVVFGNIIYSIIVVQKFNDQDGDGVQEGGEPFLDGWRMMLQRLVGGSWIPLKEDFTSGGQVVFSDLPPGHYRVQEELQPGWLNTTPGNPFEFDVGSDSIVTVKFGNTVPTPTPTLTPTSTATATPTDTATATLTSTPTLTETPVPTSTNTPVPTSTNTPVPSSTDTPLPTSTNTPVPTSTNTPVDTATASPTPLPATPTPSGTAIVVDIPTSTPTPSLCGNGDLDPGEECDDGDNISGDCCAANCKLEAAGAPCDDGLICTTGDACDGFGICRGSPSIGDYAILRWASNDPSVSVQTILGRKIVVRGHVCTDRIRTFRKARVAGDAIAMANSGAAVSFARNSTVQGAVVTGGGTVRRSTNAIVWGDIDTSGSAPQLGACDDARARAGSKYAELSARPVTAGFDEGLVKIKPGKSRRIPDTGTLPDGEVVIQLSELKVGRKATLKLVGSPTTTKVIVRINGPMRLGRAAAIELEGLRAEQVIYVVSGIVRAGGSARLGGTVLGNDKITVYRINKIEGSLFGRTAIAARSTIIRRRPWVGWCD